MLSEELTQKYTECNVTLAKAGEALSNAKTYGEVERAKDEYFMAAFGMLMIQNHMALEMLTQIMEKLGMKK